MKKLYLNTLFFILSTIAFPFIFEVSGYMFPFSLEFNFIKFIIGLLSILFISKEISGTSQSKSIFVDILILFTFIPFASTLCYLNYPFWYIFIPLSVVISVIFSINQFARIPLININSIKI